MLHTDRQTLHYFNQQHTDLIMIREGYDRGTYSKNHTGVDLTVSVSGAVVRASEVIWHHGYHHSLLL